MWRELVKRVSEGNQYVKLNSPATMDDISKVEKSLCVKLPPQLRELLLELNGDNYFLLSTTQIIETNVMLRSLTCFMPLNCMLFVAGNGCGDYYGYAIAGDGLKESDIYMWDHEYDNRIYRANGLQDAIEKYYTDKL